MAEVEKLARLLCKLTIDWESVTSADTIWKGLPTEVRNRFQRQAAWVAEQMGGIPGEAPTSGLRGTPVRPSPVRVGQVWQRTGNLSDRTVRIVDVVTRYAYVEPVGPGRASRISLRPRVWGGPTLDGYRLIEEAPDGPAVEG